MDNEIIGIAMQLTLMIAFSYPLGVHIAKVYKSGKDILGFLAPMENKIYELCSIDPDEQMDWKRFLKDFLAINLVWLIWGIVFLVLQGHLPLNPDRNPGQNLSLAFHTCASFLTNCNLQHYSGETGLTYLTQIAVVMLFQFFSAASGLAAFAGLLKAIDNKSSHSIGNFRVYFVRSITRILLPVSILVAFILTLCGLPMTLNGSERIMTMEGQMMTIFQGPVAAIEAIKQIGTNGGGFFAANSASTLENPSYFSNMVECISIMLIPMAQIWAFGKYLGRKKLSICIFCVMFFGYFSSVVAGTYAEMKLNDGISAMEGKEVRLGSAASAFWAMTTTSSSNGSANCNFDDLSPLSQLSAMVNMETNCWFGGVGVGFMNYYVFIIIAVFISGLMIGRTPEFLGKKIEAREMKIAIVIALIHPLMILAGTAFSILIQSGPHSFHSFSQMSYEFTSASANNGSGMGSLSFNGIFWNISTGIVMLVGRYLPIAGQLAIAGMLSNKKSIPENIGTLKTDTVTFSIMTYVVILIVAVLSFFPALTLGPIAELLQ